MLRRTAFPTLFGQCNGNDTKEFEAPNTVYLPYQTVAMELDITSDEEFQEEIEYEMKDASTQTSGNFHYLKNSDREKELQRRINILQKRLARREARISSMQSLLQYLKTNKDCDGRGLGADTYPGTRSLIREAFKTRGIPQERLSSLPPYIIEQYNGPCKAWWAFCKRKDLPLYTPNISDIREFLHKVLTRDNKYGTFDCYRSALALITLGDIEPDPKLRRFLKGITRVSPPKRCCSLTWKPRKVLEYLEMFYPNEDLSLEELTKKLITLLVLVTGHKFQAFRLMNIENVMISIDSVEILIPDEITTASTKSLQPRLHLPYFTEKPEICVGLTLCQYIEVTAPLRITGQEPLFLTAVPPYCAASTQTLNRWVRDTLKESGIITGLFAAYSTNHTSLSAPFRGGISLDLLRKTADWSDDPNTFASFYNCDKYV